MWVGIGGFPVATFGLMATESRRETTSRERSGRRIPTRPGLRPAFPPPTSRPVRGLPSPTVSSGEVIAERASRPTITYTHETVIAGEEAEALWALYACAMEPVDDLAALRHFEPRDEVLRAFAEPEITKIVARSGPTPIGLVIITNRLDMIPGVSPAFFENKFPEHATLQRIFYVSAVLVDPNRRGRTVFSRLLNEMTGIAQRVGGVMVFDTCDFNRENYRMDTVVQRIVDRFPRSTWKVIDQQTWYAAELPEPKPDR